MTGFDRQNPGNTPETSHGSPGEQGPGQPTSGDRVVGEQGPGHPEAAPVTAQQDAGGTAMPTPPEVPDEQPAAERGAQSGGPVPGGAPEPQTGWERPAAAPGHSGWQRGGWEAGRSEWARPGYADTGQHQVPFGVHAHYSGFHQPQPQKKRSGAFVAGVTVLALLVGGGAGAAGGYLVAESQSGMSGNNALNVPPPAKQASTPAPAGSVEAVADKVLPTVVQLQVRGRSGAGEGSGFVISADGLIVTNNHVVEAAGKGGGITAVFQDGRTARATIVGRDPTSDVAVVKAQGIKDLPVAELGRSDDLRVGQAVVAVGSPFELAGTVTSGIISALQRPTRAGGEDGSQATVLDAIQTDAAINPGNSGGPLVNMQGQVIGINSAIYSPGAGSREAGSVGIGFAIPINQARRTADQIVDTGKATQTVLGVTVRDNPDGIGAMVNEVVPGGGGDKAGLRSGDVITRLNERRIDGADALVAAVRAHAPGDKVTLVIGTGDRTVEATLGGQPVEVN